MTPFPERNAVKLRFLTWNISPKNDVSSVLERLSFSFSIDFFLLTEAKALKAMPPGLADYVFVEDLADPNPGIKLLMRKGVGVSRSIHFSEQLRFRSFVFEPTPGLAFLLFIVHLVDARNYSLMDRFVRTQELSRQIMDIEAAHSNHRTIVAGDFNLNPFDPAMYHKGSLNALPCKLEVQRSYSKRPELRSGWESMPFYNPTWSLLGDLQRGPAGTYYWSNGELSWNTLDQVLLRPAIMDSLTDLRTIDSTKDGSLCTVNGIPRKSTISDHLPILFTLDITEVEND